MQDQDNISELPLVEAKETWSKPEIVSVTPIADAEGGGGAGFDFASEQS